MEQTYTIQINKKQLQLIQRAVGLLILEDTFEHFLNNSNYRETQYLQTMFNNLDEDEMANPGRVHGFAL